MEPGYAEAFFAEGSCAFQDWTPESLPLQKGADQQHGWLQALLLTVLETQQKAQEHLRAYMARLAEQQLYLFKSLWGAVHRNHREARHQDQEDVTPVGDKDTGRPCPYQDG